MKINTRELPWVVALVGLAFMILWPLLKPGFIVTDDGDWMVIRLSAFFQSLRDGQFPVRFLGRLNFSYGYPVSNFLYPGFLYLGSIIHILGFSFVDSVKLLFIGSAIGTVIILFFWLRIFFSTTASFLGALSFIFSPYVVFDIYKRGSIGEVVALFFACLLFFSIDAKKKWIIPFATSMLLISHNTLGLVFTVVIFVYTLYSKKNWIYLPMCIGGGLATFFWAPALYERKYVVFDNTIVSNPFSYFASGETTYLLGYTMLVACICALLLKYPRYSSEKKILLSIFGIGIFLATPVSAPIWNWDILGKIIQFPFRFLSVNVVVGSWLLAYVVNRSIFSKYVVIPIVAVLFFLQILPVLKHIQFEEKADGFYVTNEATTTVANEYMPKWVISLPQVRPDNKIQVYDGIAKVMSNSSTTETVKAVIESQGESIIQINSLYYPGWGVLVNNQLVSINYNDPKNPLGLIRFKVPTGTNTIFAQFRETVPRFLANVTSFLFFVLYLVYLTHKYDWEKQKNEYA